MRSFALVAAATVAITAAAPALAAPANSTEFNATVEHDDLDLTTQRGIARLDERVRTTVRRACANGGRDSASIRLERECRNGALAAAETQVRLAIVEANADRPRFASNSTAAVADTPGA